MPPTRNSRSYRSSLEDNAYGYTGPQMDYLEDKIPSRQESTTTSLRRPTGGFLRRRSTAVSFASQDGDEAQRGQTEGPSDSSFDTQTSTPGASSSKLKRPSLGRKTSSKGRAPSLRSSDIRGVTSPADAHSNPKTRASFASGISYKERISLLRRQSREIYEHVERKSLLAYHHIIESLPR